MMNVASNPKIAALPSPECRMAGLGLILRVLDRNQSSFSDCYVEAPDGSHITFGDAQQMFENLIGLMTEL